MGKKWLLYLHVEHKFAFYLPSFLSIQLLILSSIWWHVKQPWQMCSNIFIDTPDKWFIITKYDNKKDQKLSIDYIYCLEDIRIVAIIISDTKWSNIKDLRCCKKYFILDNLHQCHLTVNPKKYNVRILTWHSLM